MRKYLFALMLVSASIAVQAKVAPTTATDPALEKRVMALAEDLRCLVCQNQSLADSHADLAIDLKNQVREKLAQGMSERAVVDYMVERYGDFVLYKPPVKATTWLLWFGPFLFLFGGLLFLGLKLRGGRREEDDVPEPDLQRAAALLNTDKEIS